eukprot:gene7364-15035_t
MVGVTISFVFGITILSSFCSINSSKWVVSFATILPRFPFCIETVNSWLKQTKPPNHILIFVTPNWDPERKRRIQLPIPHNSNNNTRHYYSHTDILRELIDSQFPNEYASGVIAVIEVPVDYGPATKFIGVLMSLNIYETDYWLIGDDDLIYTNNIISKYDTFYAEHPPSVINGPVLTLFQHKRHRFRVKIFDQIIYVYHIQGADTYVFPHALLKRHSQIGYPLSYTQFPLLLEHMFKVCPSTFLYDDYSVSYAIAISNITLHTLWKGFTAYSENDKHPQSQLHYDKKTAKRLQYIMTCFANQTQNLINIWGYDPPYKHFAPFFFGNGNPIPNIL